MEADYPAAHSMDAYWFAIDERGQVALFEGEDEGCAPEGYDPSLIPVAMKLIEFPDTSLDDGFLPDEWAEHLGIVVYRDPEWDDELVHAYVRVTNPRVPCHLDELPLTLRAAVQTFRFHDVRFDQAERLHAVTHFSCTIDELEGRRPAYVETDCVTVRPIPGREAEFAAFVARYRRREPKRAEGFLFEGPTE